MTYSIYDFIGNIGVFLVLAAFYLLQTNKIKSEDPKYSWLNLIGAIAITVSLLNDFNLSSFIIEIFWMAFSIIGLVKYYSSKKSVNNMNVPPPSNSTDQSSS